jgi:uncharacterized membrane protein YsdA (DUF1294 family)
VAYLNLTTRYNRAVAEDKIYLFGTITEKTVVEVFGFLLYHIDKSQAEEDQYKFEKQIRR